MSDFTTMVTVELFASEKWDTWGWPPDHIIEDELEGQSWEVETEDGDTVEVEVGAVGEIDPGLIDDGIAYRRGLGVAEIQPDRHHEDQSWVTIKVRLPNAMAQLLQGLVRVQPEYVYKVFRLVAQKINLYAEKSALEQAAVNVAREIVRDAEPIPEAEAVELCGAVPIFDPGVAYEDQRCHFPRDHEGPHSWGIQDAPDTGPRRGWVGDREDFHADG